MICSIYIAVINRSFFLNLTFQYLLSFFWWNQEVSFQILRGWTRGRRDNPACSSWCASLWNSIVWSCSLVFWIYVGRCARPWVPWAHQFVLRFTQANLLHFTPLEFAVIALILAGYPLHPSNPHSAQPPWETSTVLSQGYQCLRRHSRTSSALWSSTTHPAFSKIFRYFTLPSPFYDFYYKLSIKLNY